MLITKVEEQRTGSVQRDESSFTLDRTHDGAISDTLEDEDSSAPDDEAPSKPSAELASASKLSRQLSALHTQLSTLSTQASHLWYRHACLQTYWAKVEAVSAQDQGAVKWLAEKLTQSTADVSSAEVKLEDEILMLVVLRGQGKL